MNELWSFQVVPSDYGFQILPKLLSGMKKKFYIRCILFCYKWNTLYKQYNDFHISMCKSVGMHFHKYKFFSAMSLHAIFHHGNKTKMSSITFALVLHNGHQSLVLSYIRRESYILLSILCFWRSSVMYETNVPPVTHIFIVSRGGLSSSISSLTIHHYVWTCWIYFQFITLLPCPWKLLGIYI